MNTMEMDNNGHWTDPDPDKCLECKRARECSTKFFYLNREYPKQGTHCECGHLSQALPGSTEEEESKAAGRLPHTKICADHFIAIWERLLELHDLEESPDKLDRADK